MMQVKIDIKGVEHVLSMLNPKEQRTIIMRVANELARDARAEVRREIRDRYNLKLSDVEVKVIKATPASLTASLLGSSRRIPLHKFGAKKTGSGGVSVMIKRGKRVVVKNAFLARPQGIDYSKRGQKKRVVSALSFVFKRGSGKKPYSIENLRTFSIWKVIHSKRMTSNIQSFVGSRAGRLLEGHVNLLLFKRRVV